jgi:hypothetical protein
MAVFNIILRYLTFIFLVRKSVQKVFCKIASPLYFSLLRILLTVLACHFDLPPGEGIPFDVRILTIPVGVYPSRKSL